MSESPADRDSLARLMASAKRTHALAWLLFPRTPRPWRSSTDPSLGQPGKYLLDLPVIRSTTHGCGPRRDGPLGSAGARPIRAQAARPTHFFAISWTLRLSADT